MEKLPIGDISGLCLFRIMIIVMMILNHDHDDNGVNHDDNDNNDYVDKSNDDNGNYLTGAEPPSRQMFKCLFVCLNV